jgi:cyclopropane-fatty-acyl-phospholipid synthase
VARTWYSLRSNVTGNIQFHYDRSNRFYQTFLDSRMVYSCGYFRKPTDSLEEAQRAKLDHVCRKLRVERGDRFLDVGCGWGGLMFHAAERYGAKCTGCTLSHAQVEFVQEKLENRGGGDQIRVFETDFQKVRGRFDKIASVGMFEHVGRRRLRSYFAHIAGSLAENGLFLNHAIARPETVKDGAETLFLQRNVFPGGDLLHVSEVIRTAEEAGFEVLDLENLRPHYALTCRAWVNGLQAAAEDCLRTVTRDVYRTWLLYLAACAVSFEDGTTDIHQALFAKRSPSQRRPLTREYMYRR